MKELITKLLPREKNARILFFLIIAGIFILGWLVGNLDENDTHQTHQSIEAGASDVTAWTCSMHPQIQQPKPGKCPICGMDLIPVASEKTGDNPRQVYLSNSNRKLAQIEVAAVERKFVQKEIRMVGKIEYDETRLKYITAWVPGRIERLYVNYTGIPVRKGDHLVEIYSPELLSTQQELIESLSSLENSSRTEFPEMNQLAVQQLNSVRERLRLWGLTDAQITELEKEKKPTDHMTIYSPTGGIVVERNALEGTYLETGSRIYTIADLSQVWIKIDAYESDLSWLRYGQEVEFYSEAYPGEKFTGRISFIDPVLNPQTRTVKVRVIVANPQNKLKPEMFVQAIVKSNIAAGGKVMDPDLSGKWISPMHPEIIKDHPGTCDVCGMKLVKAENLGYVSSKSAQQEAPLVIPATAPLITGKRAVVYVTVPGEEGVYEGREVTLGPRAGDYYLVESGLVEGERVVVKGNFKIDSAIQIKAGPSMMNPEGRQTATNHQHAHGTAPMNPAEKTSQRQNEERITGIPGEFLNQLDEIYLAYFEIQHELSQDNLAQSKVAAKLLTANLEKVDMKPVKGKVREKWMQTREQLNNASQEFLQSDQIDSARKAFEGLSNALITAARTFGSNRQYLLVYHCPMAFDFKGADWLQNKQGTANPYFGSTMFSCGSQTEDLTSPAMKNQEEGQLHE